MIAFTRENELNTRGMIVVTILRIQRRTGGDKVRVSRYIEFSVEATSLCGNPRRHQHFLHHL